MLQKDIHDKMVQTTEEFLTDVALLFPHDNQDIKLVREFGKNLGGEKLSKHISKYILQYREQIEKRETIFFRNNKEKIFIGLPKKKVERFETLIFEENSTHNIDTLWKYFDIFLYLSREYEPYTLPS